MLEKSSGYIPVEQSNWDGRGGDIAVGVPAVQCLTLTHRLTWAAIIIIIAITGVAEMILLSRHVTIFAICSNVCSDRHSGYQPVPRAKHRSDLLFRKG